MIYFIIVVSLFYFGYTLSFAMKFNNTDTYFTDKQRLLHNVLIWLIPFFWIMIIKTMTKPTPGSSKVEKTKSRGGFYESGIGIWGHGNFDDHHHDSGGASESGNH